MVNLVAQSWARTMSLYPIGIESEESLELHEDDLTIFEFNYTIDELKNKVKNLHGAYGDKEKVHALLQHTVDELLEEEVEQCKFDFSEDYGFPIENIIEAGVWIKSITVNNEEIILSPFSDFDVNLFYKALNRGGMIW